MYSIGVDIEKTERFRELAENFLENIYSMEEIDYCKSKEYPYLHFAVRFCAKEALCKAFYMSGLNPPPLKEIKIKNLENGQPVIKLGKKYDHFDIKVSLSHCEDTAVAMVMIWKQ